MFKNALQRASFIFFIVLFCVAMLNYIPGLTDSEGRTFGIFKLNLYNDFLHFGSSFWALYGAITSKKNAYIFLRFFGLSYFFDGLLGLFTGMGFLDFGIFIYGVQNYSFFFKVLANAPHILLGLSAFLCSYFFKDKTNA